MSRIAGLSRRTGCSRASEITSGWPDSTTCWQKECESGVCRCWAQGWESPTQLLKNCRSSSTSDTSATGTLSTVDVSRVRRSKLSSAGLSSNRVSRSSRRRAGAYTALGSRSPRCRRAARSAIASIDSCASESPRRPARKASRTIVASLTNCAALMPCIVDSSSSSCQRSSLNRTVVARIGMTAIITDTVGRVTIVTNGEHSSFR